MHLSHSVNRVGSQLQPKLGYMEPPFLKCATKVKLSTGAGLPVRGGTSYPLKMVIGTSYFQRMLFKIFMKNVQFLRKISACK
jgi:hypothetical protein